MAGFADKKELALLAQKSRTGPKTQRKVRGPEAWNETRRVRNLTSSIAPLQPVHAGRDAHLAATLAREDAMVRTVTQPPSAAGGSPTSLPLPVQKRAFLLPTPSASSFHRAVYDLKRCRRGETGADVRPRDGLGPSYRRAVECTSTAAGRKASADLSSKLPWQRPCRPTCAVLAARQKHRVARCC